MDLLSMKKSVNKNEWYNFVKNSILLNNDLPSEIINSWRRSLRVDPSSSETNIISVSVYNKIREENRDLIEISKPIMNDICEIAGKSFVLLCDNKGRTIDKVSNIDYPVPVRRIYSESNVGTNAIGTAIVEKKPIEIRNKEHYNIHFHQYSCAGVPILTNGEVIGVVCVVNPYQDLPQGFSKTVRLGVKVIEKQLQLKHDEKISNEESSLYKLFDSIQDCLIITDFNGELLFANKAFTSTLGEKDKNNILGNSIKNLIADKSIASELLSDKLNVDKLKISFEWKNKKYLAVVRKRWHFNHSEKIYIFFQVQEDNIANNGNIVQNLVTFNDIVGTSKVWLTIKEKGIKASHVDTHVLIVGESGTGKELIAQAIHKESGRSGKFVPINCGAISKGLLESELFGYEEGAFTGAIKKGKAGKIEIADGGTLFLDEIGEMQFDMQVSLLRFLENRLITRVGGSTPRRVDVRIIAATNRDLSDEIKNGNFREDLFFRLNVIKLEMPPLRERREDIALLANNLAELKCRQFGRSNVDITDETIEILNKYQWPGNVRELRNVIESTLVFLEGNTILPEHLPDYILNIKDVHGTEELNLFNDAEKEVILETLEQCNGNVTSAAKKLGIARNTLYSKMKKLGIKKR